MHYRHKSGVWHFVRKMRDGDILRVFELFDYQYVNTLWARQNPYPNVLNYQYTKYLKKTAQPRPVERIATYWEVLPDR